MKVVLVIQILMVFVESTDHTKSCIKALKIPTNKKGTPDKNHKNFKCLTMCIYKKMDLINNNGTFNVWQFKDIYKAFIDPCNKKISNEDECEKIQKFDDCIKVEYKKSFHNCASISKVSPSRETRHEVLSNNVGDDLACYQRCIYNKYKILDEKDQVNATELAKYVPKGYKVEGTLKKCKEATNQTGTCVRVLHVLQCVWKQLNRQYTKSQRVCFKDLEMKTDENGLPSLTDPKFKCMDRCIYLKYGLITVNGSFVVKNFNHYYRPVIPICEKKVAKDDECTKVANFKYCIWPESVKLRRKCANETNVKVQQYGTIPKLADDKNACYHRCVLKNYNFLNDKDEIDVKTVKGYLKKDVKIDDVVKKCQNENKQVDKCVKALHIVQCANNFFRYPFN